MFILKNLTQKYFNAVCDQDALISELSHWRGDQRRQNIMTNQKEIFFVYGFKKWYDGEVIELFFFLIKIADTHNSCSKNIYFFCHCPSFEARRSPKQKIYLVTLYKLHRKCNPDTKSIQTWVVPKVTNSLEVIDRACFSEHCNITVWNALVQVHCWLLKIPPRLHLSFFSHCLNWKWKKKKKSLGLCLCITKVLICADCIWHLVVCCRLGFMTEKMIYLFCDTFFFPVWNFLTSLHLYQ